MDNTDHTGFHVLYIVNGLQLFAELVLLFRNVGVAAYWLPLLVLFVWFPVWREKPKTTNKQAIEQP